MKALLRDKYGVAGWDLAKDQFKNYEHEKMLEDIQKEKARNVAEFSRTPAGIALAIGAPTMYQEGVRQACRTNRWTREDYGEHTDSMRLRWG